MLKRGKDIKKISAVVRMLANGETLPPQYCDHADYGGYLLDVLAPLKHLFETFFL